MSDSVSAYFIHNGERVIGGPYATLEQCAAFTSVAGGEAVEMKLDTAAILNAQSLDVPSRHWQDVLSDLDSYIASMADASE